MGHRSHDIYPSTRGSTGFAAMKRHYGSLNRRPAVQCSDNPARRSPLLEALFPMGVRAAELRLAGNPALLFADELKYVSAAVPKRVREFAAGRLCARRALAEFGVNEAPLKVGRDRQPLWPAGFVGSITHTDGFCGAVVADRREFLAVGLDAEIVGRVTADLWREILSPSEIIWLNSLVGADQLTAAMLIFSAKEAFYKCQFTLTGEWLDFADAVVRFSTMGEGIKSFSIRPLKPLTALDEIKKPIYGQQQIVDNLVFSGIALQG